MTDSYGVWGWNMCENTTRRMKQQLWCTYHYRHVVATGVSPPGRSEHTHS